MTRPKGNDWKLSIAFSSLHKKPVAPSLLAHSGNISNVDYIMYMKNLIGPKELSS